MYTRAKCAFLTATNILQIDVDDHVHGVFTCMGINIKLILGLHKANSFCFEINSILVKMY